MSKTYRNPSKRYSVELKRQICEEVIQSQMTVEQARRHYCILGHSNIYRWLHNFGYQLPTSKAIMPKSKKSTKLSNGLDQINDPEILKARIAELEKALSHANLRAKGLDTMINIAEEELKIPIRKKSSTKRSNTSARKRQK